MTTRRLDLLEDAPRIRVDEMTGTEAQQLVRSASGTPSLSSDRLAGLAKRLGEWPLLLKLAAGMVRARLGRGDSPEGALIHLEGLLDKHGVTFDARDNTARNAAVKPHGDGEPRTTRATG